MTTGRRHRVTLYGGPLDGDVRADIPIGTTEVILPRQVHDRGRLIEERYVYRRDDPDDTQLTYVGPA